MKNIELLNICYKYRNRLINAKDLLSMLNGMDLNQLTSKDRTQTKKFISEIKNIVDTVPNKEDELVVKENETIKRMLDKFSNTPNEFNELISKNLESLKTDYNREKDSYELWYKINEFISKSDYFNSCFDSLSKYELLEFITKYISVPNPINISQDEFDELVGIGIENDEREWLWRLAFNYENRNINFDAIVNYFIEKKDGYYLSELISAVGECLDINSIVKCIKDKELILDLKTRKGVLESYLAEDDFKTLFGEE